MEYFIVYLYKISSYELRVACYELEYGYSKINIKTLSIVLDSVFWLWTIWILRASVRDVDIVTSSSS